MINDGQPKAMNIAAVTTVDAGDQAILSPQCPACGRPEQITWVHGYGRCSHCNTNVMPCCDGAMCVILSLCFYCLGRGVKI